MENKFLKINPADNVVVAIQPISAGETIAIDGKEIKVNQDTPAGHKILLEDINEGVDVIKYGYPIGHAKQNLKQGDWVNENNLKTNLAGLLDYTYNPVKCDLDIANRNLTFKGYRRKNGHRQPYTRVVIDTIG